MKSVKVAFVGGFLGSGKTTHLFLRLIEVGKKADASVAGSPIS